MMGGGVIMTQIARVGPDLIDMSLEDLAKIFEFENQNYASR
ncbi:hypothetical protein CBM2592_A10109 [Cupriavidus taiwanensis]|nr:hypothetical protein CBM2588_A10107 [Cupriavidus taiwanensis]SOY42393.1 hypothetical protein CBM2592_A10109 [Cupriavidus taiwanensis]SOY78988.1 hypothetical protein CBM2591_A10108 [Cupriavidus taiwanensis]SOZ50293.1 hypothetical protein CBM2617_A10057 [Cupriavidus taiwanensis]SOZ75653.1 hypothetical protein CBM2622_A10058 [Cupriavidus taiwanensis]